MPGGALGNRRQNLIRRVDPVQDNSNRIPQPPRLPNGAASSPAVRENNRNNRNNERIQRRAVSQASVVPPVPSPGPLNNTVISDQKREELLSSLQSNGVSHPKPKLEEFNIDNYAVYTIQSLEELIQKRKKDTKQLEQLLQTKKEENNLCVICLEETRNTVCIPCGHLAYCNTCVEGLKRKGYSSCGLCRETVSAYTKIFFV